MKEEIRNTIKDDIDGIKEILNSNELFPIEYLDHMISDYFDNPQSEEIWFTYIQDNKVLGFGYCVPEKMTEGTCNLLLIAVRKDYQGKGAGKKMMNYIEHLLQSMSKRILIVETSSDDQFVLTREFYKKLDYHHEATIREFWSPGEDKIVFWKKLS
ncbi:MAG: N-acetyltransferase family protein [Hyphomicrobiales bacterium]